MMQEREFLMKNVFPKLRKLCREKGYDFTEVDLRWGITEEDAEKGKVIEICLNEIDKSRPFFIGMIGERYGWIPEIEDSRDFEKMLNNFECFSSRCNCFSLSEDPGNPIAGHSIFRLRSRGLESPYSTRHTQLRMQRHLNFFPARKS